MNSPHCNRRAIFLTMALAGLSLGVMAQSPKGFPNQPIKIVVPYPPGGGSDGLMRQLGQLLSKKLNTPVIVDNRPGANTILATEYVSKQPADGYTLLYVDSAFTINPALYPLRYSPVESFTSVALVTEIPLVVLTHQDAPYTHLRDVVAAARVSPEKISFASYGQGSRAHLAGEMLAMETQTKLLHVPFKGSADALNSLMGKHVDFSISTIEPALPLIKNGKLRALAVTTQQRTPALAHVPTVAETIPGFNTVGWGGLVAPKGTPPEVIKQLTSAVNEVILSPQMQERFSHQGMESKVRDAEFMNAMIRAEVPKWKQVVDAAKIKAH